MVEGDKKYKLNQFAIAVYAFLVFMGLILGPYSWYRNHAFVFEYDSFAQDAIETKGTVYKRWKKIRGKSSNCYISVRYSRMLYDISLASKVEVLHSLDVDKGDDVIVLYHPGKPDNEIRIKGETEWNNLPPILKPYVGPAYTLFAYLSIIFFLVRRLRVKKKSTITNV